MDVSCLTLNRLSVYLRCLRSLRERGVERTSSQELARNFGLNAAQIRKDLACFGEFGIRGVGYDVAQLEARLRSLLGLDRRHSLVVVGMGNLGRAVARHLAHSRSAFDVVGGFDSDPEIIGLEVGPLTVRSTGELPGVIAEQGVEVGVIAVPAEAAQEAYDDLVAAGIRAVLNFSPVRLRRHPEVRTRTVDLRIYLEELVFFLAAARDDEEAESGLHSAASR